jgi:REP element-mobilizing transposase RayT
LRTCWILLLEEYGVKFEYLPRKKNGVADTLFCLDIDSMKIQEEEVLTLLSGSENNIISNIKWLIPMHTALIFKEQAKVKEPRLTEKGLAQPHYSIQHIEGYSLLCYKDNMQDLHSSIIKTENKE